MSDTPQTDAFAKVANSDAGEELLALATMMLTHARQLERELAEAQRHIVALEHQANAHEAKLAKCRQALAKIATYEHAFCTTPQDLQGIAREILESTK